MSERVKLALVGCGGMGRRHLRGLAVLAGSSQANLELVAVSDLNEENANFLADEAAQLLGIRPAVYNDVARMAREVEGLRATSVTTDAGSHHVVVTTCLEAGLPVLREAASGHAAWLQPGRWTPRSRPAGPCRLPRITAATRSIDWSAP